MNILNFQKNNDDESPAGFSAQNQLDSINAAQVIQIACCISNINKYKKNSVLFSKAFPFSLRFLTYRLMMNGFYLYFLRLWKYKPARLIIILWNQGEKWLNK